jgi:hypothetical protein
MQTRTLLLTGAIVCLTALAIPGCKQKKNRPQPSGPVTLTGLLNEMTDRESITRYPDFSLKQVSSWDRTQTGPDHPDTWFNNKDYGYFIRQEQHNGRTEYVILDENGPGCIVRWWIPLENTYSRRTVRIYIDGEEKPVIEENYHDFISGKTFIGEPFAFVSSDERDSAWQTGLPAGHPKQLGADFYFPVPYSKSCRVTLDDNPFYYAIGFRSYPAGTSVESFSTGSFEHARARAAETATKLTVPESFDFSLGVKDTIPPGGMLKINLPEGDNAVRSVRVRFFGEPSGTTLRSCAMVLTFDGEEPSWCPASEFFGGGVYLRPVWNRAGSITEEGTMQSFWIMPYRQSGSVAVQNNGTEPVFLQMKIAVSPYRWESTSMYFHTGWHEEAPIKTTQPVDWNYVRITGKGVYAGDVLTVHAFSKGWWGEGDEKIYADGEDFPSQLGTGLEDYYGFAWGMAHVFSSPFISVPLRDARGKADWSGYTTISRIRVLDAIPFSTSLDMNVEAWVHDSTVSFSNATFWYALPGAKSNRTAETAAVRRTLPVYEAGRPVEKPGLPMPDPSAGGLIPPAGNGTIRQAGNHLDCLGWRSTDVPKPLDSDNDSVYGTAGYSLPACRYLDPRTIQFSEDTLPALPSWVAAIQYTGENHWTVPDAWLTDPKQPGNWLISGAIRNKTPNGTKPLVSITLGRQAPSSFRLGIMTDNLDAFVHNARIRITGSTGGDSGWMPVAASNRLPDWYFFDVTGCSAGEVIAVTLQSTGADKDISVGGITFDEIRK